MWLAAKITIILFLVGGSIVFLTWAALSIIFTKGIRRDRYDHRVGGVINL
jgi:hypothetical protein